jgi:hypothetical protein
VLAGSNELEANESPNRGETVYYPLQVMYRMQSHWPMKHKQASDHVGNEDVSTPCNNRSASRGCVARGSKTV